MGWDAYWKSGFQDDGAFLANGKQHEGKDCHKVQLGRWGLGLRRKCHSKNVERSLHRSQQSGSLGDPRVRVRLGAEGG